MIAITLGAGVVATIRQARIARGQAAIASIERARAEKRFSDVRELANSLIFEIHDSIQGLPGATPSRKLLLDRAVQYLDKLSHDAAGDLNLQRELAWAYSRLATVQGDTTQIESRTSERCRGQQPQSAAVRDGRQGKPRQCK